MASETPVSDHPATPQPQEVEKELQSEVKKTEQGSVSAPEVAAVDTPCVAAPPASLASDPKTEEKIIAKPIEPPAAEVLKKAEAAEEKPAEQPLAEEVKKAEAAPSLVGSTEEKGAEVAPKMAELAEEKVECKTVEPVVQEEKKIEDVALVEAPDKGIEGPGPAGKPVESLQVGSIEENPLELEKIAQPVKVEELPAKVSAAAEVKDIAVAEAACKPEDASAAVAPTPGAKSTEVVKQVEKEPQSQEVEDVKTDVGECSDQVKAETLVSKDGEKGNELKESAKEVIPVDEATEKKVNVDQETEVKPEEKSVVAEELVPCEQKPDEAVASSVPPPEKSKEVTSRDIEPVANTGNKKEETVALGETAKDVKSEAETTKEPGETDAATEAKLEDEKRVDEPAKTDVEHSENSKEVTTKTTQDKDKGDVKTKLHKPSFVKMVKQSLVKAKKAIVGKSNQTKTPAPEPKDQANK